MKPRAYISGKPKSRYFGPGSSTPRSANTPSSSSTPGTPSYSLPGAGNTSRGPPPPPPPIQNEDRRVTEYSSSDDTCPVCSTDRYLQPKLRLLVSSCYHKLCESCIDRVFSMGPAPCPTCGLTIRKNAFRPQMFEKLDVQKEVNIRRQLARIFNKREDEFPSLESYNKYLEEAEEITYRLISTPSVEEIQRTIDSLKAQHAENLAEARERAEREEEERLAVKKAEEEEVRRRKETREGWEKALKGEEEERERRRKEVLVNLESSTASADSILDSLRLPSTFSLPFIPLPRVPTPPPFSLVPDNALDPLAWFDSYDHLFTLFEPLCENGPGYHALGREAELTDSARVGGYKVKEGWEKAVRGGVAGLWEPPVQDFVFNLGM